jgi:hypothetical protein
MKQRSLFERLILPGIAVLCLFVSLWAVHFQSQIADRPISLLVRTAFVLRSTQFAIADFDGDLQPDLARIRVSRDGSPTSEYSVDLNFSSGAKPAIFIVGPSGGLQIIQRDVNGDKFADLVITSILDSRFVVVYLNDGKGNFIPAKSSEFPGAGNGTDFRFIAPADIPAGQLAVPPGRDSAGDPGTPARWAGMREVSAATLPATPPNFRSELDFASSGRAPPHV